MFFLGSFYLWSNISTYVLSYFYIFNPNLNVGFIPLVDTMLKFSFWLGLILGSYLMQNLRVKPKKVLMLGSGVALVGILGASFTKSLWPFLLCYGGANGIGQGTCYMVPLICGWEYFPTRKGLVSGIALSSYGFSSFVFGLLSTALVNP